MSKQRTRAARRRTAPRGVRRGSALLELALVLPFLAALLLGVADIARAYGEQVAIAEAAHQGARAWVLTGGNDATAVQAAIDNAINDPDLSGRITRLNICRDPSCAPDYTPGAVTVRITYRYNLLFGFFDDIVGGNQLVFSNSATMPLGVTGP
ncbi:MAG TPA: TadE/TadG family type IV pilus assembly protein [Chloroflexia bacterium]